ncbi:MAG: type II toxin-antitoxin system RelE/ParE family toxin [Dehalococcoidales bacterium]|nr:type II toxin-antitoxin system RelE/ParE family toxin [Dehalococcoidales bacterium]
MSYRVWLSSSVSSYIKQLDKNLQNRILKRIAWLGNNYENIRHIQLTGSYSGLYKFRIGDYRLIYSIDHGKKTIKALDFKHRKDIYK